MNFLVHISWWRISVKLVIAIVDVFSCATSSITFTQLSWFRIMAIWQVCSTWWAIMNSYWYQFQTIWTGWWLFHANPPTTTCFIPVWFPGNVGPHNTWCTFQTMPRTAVFVAIDGQVVIVLLRTKIHDSNHREWPQRYLTLLRCTIWLGKMRAREASAFDLTRLWRLLFPQTSQSGTIPSRWHRPARLISFTSVISLMRFTNLVRLMSFTTVVNLISLISSTTSPGSLAGSRLIRTRLGIFRWTHLFWHRGKKNPTTPRRRFQQRWS